MSLSINNLPAEVLQHVFNFIEDDKTLAACTQVSKEWRANLLSFVRHQESDKLRFKEIRLPSLTYQENSQTYQEDTDLSSLDSIDKIRSVTSNLGSITFAHQLLEINSNLTSPIFYFLEAGLLERALEVAAEISSEKKEHAYQPIVEYMLKKGHPIENIIKIFKLLSPSTQEAIILNIDIKILDINQANLFAECMSRSDVKDMLLMLILDTALEEDNIDLEKINYLLSNIHSGSNYYNVIAKSLDYIVSKENIDTDLATNILSLYDTNPVKRYLRRKNHLIFNVCKKLVEKHHPDSNAIDVIANLITDNNIKDKLLI